jgi:CheY-like chemotaxis protein
MDRKNILLVEDDPIAICITGRKFLSAPGGTHLQTVTDGMEARRYMSGAGRYADRANHPLPDLILLDIHMPRFSGLDFLGWLREKAPETIRSIRVVVITSCGQDAQNWARAIGVDRILLKPVRWSTFWQQLGFGAAA